MPGTTIITELLTMLEKRAAGRVLTELLHAKERSDVKRYREKHRILRSLMDKYPKDFMVDSVAGNIAGITHAPTGFRLHVPLHVLPTQFTEVGTTDAQIPQ